MLLLLTYSSFAASASGGDRHTGIEAHFGEPEKRTVPSIERAHGFAPPNRANCGV
jgi:hypothetical protein